MSTFQEQFIEVVKDVKTYNEILTENIELKFKIKELEEQIKNLKTKADFEIVDNVLIKYTGNGGDVVIPNNIVTIGDEAFEGCKNITSIIIPDSVTSIGDWAFNCCRSLTSIVIPSSVTSIGDSAFYNCKNLKTVYYQGSESDKEKIFIEKFNNNFKNANWVYGGKK